MPAIIEAPGRRPATVNPAPELPIPTLCPGALRPGRPPMPLPVRHLLRCLLALALCCCSGWGGALAQPAPALVLDAAHPEVDPWPALRLLSDPGRQLDLAAVRQRLADFRPHGGPHANLGPRRDVAWPHRPLQVAGGDGRWMSDTNDPVLNHADADLLRGDQLVQQARLGASQPSASRPMPGRTRTLALDLPPGQPHALLPRVETESAMVLPIALRTPERQQQRESGRLLLQGLQHGVALALLADSPAHWLSLRRGRASWRSRWTAAATARASNSDCWRWNGSGGHVLPVAAGWVGLPLVPSWPRWCWARCCRCWPFRWPGPATAGRATWWSAGWPAPSARSPWPACCAAGCLPTG